MKRKNPHESNLVGKIKSAALPEIYHTEKSGSKNCIAEEYLQGMYLQKYLDLRGLLDFEIVLGLRKLSRLFIARAC